MNPELSRARRRKGRKFCLTVQTKKTKKKKTKNYNMPEPQTLRPKRRISREINGQGLKINLPQMGNHKESQNVSNREFKFKPTNGAGEMGTKGMRKIFIRDKGFFYDSQKSNLIGSGKQRIEERGRAIMRISAGNCKLATGSSLGGGGKGNSANG